MCHAPVENIILDFVNLLDAGSIQIMYIRQISSLSFQVLRESVVPYAPPVHA